jgi:predicted exporter
MRALTGFDLGTQFYLVEAGSAQELLRTEEALGARLRELAAKGVLDNFHAISSFVPSAARQEENRGLLGQAVLADRARLERAFDKVGLRKGVATPAATPFRHLWLGKTERGYASIVVPFGASDANALKAAAQAVEGVTFLDKVASVTRLFGEYRKAFSYGLAIAIVVVLGVLSRRYGWRGGAAVLLPTLLGIAGSLAISGYAGMPMTLFSVMALMLVLGVGVNYAIFLVEGRGREGSAFVAVLLSAATTLLSFGLLAFSGTPALAQFGKTLVAGIGIAVLLAPLAMTLSAARPAPRPG